MIFDRNHEAQQNAFDALTATVRRERLFFYWGLCLVIVGVLSVAILATYLAMHAEVERRSEQIERYASEMGRVVEGSEVLARRMNHTVKYYFSNAGGWETGRFGDVIRTLGKSDEAQGRPAFKAEPFLIVLPQEGRKDLRASWEAEANALANIAASGMSTLDSMKIRRRAYVVGLNRDYAVLFPAVNDQRPGDAQRIGSLALVQMLREKGVGREKIAGVREAAEAAETAEGIRWNYSSGDKDHAESVLSCVGMVEVAGKGLVLFGSDLPARSLLAGIRREDTYGALGLYSSTALLIDRSAAGAWFERGAVLALRQPDETGARLTRDGLYLIEPVGEHFGHLVYGMSYVELLKATAQPIGWIWALGAAFLFALLAVVYQWNKRVLARGHLASRRAIEHEIQNHVLVSEMPMGLLIIRAADYSVMRANRLAVSLLDMRAPIKLPSAIEMAFRARWADCGPAGSEIVRFTMDLSDEARGKPFFLHIACAPVTYSAEAVLICAVSDITVQKLAELESRKAREESDRLLRARSNFFASVSHEIKTPLSVILGNVDLLPVGKLGDAEAERLKAVHTGAKALRRIVTDILDLSRVEAGVMKLVESRFYALQCVEGVVRGYVERAISRHIDFHIFQDPAMARHALIGDPSRIAQILDNLLDNAFKFTNAGGVTVRSSLVLETPACATLLLEVSDSGGGMDEQLVERIFTPFAQADGENRRYAGTGLGLSICATLCKLMGGTVTVKSILHVGSVFTVRLPLAVAPGHAVATNGMMGNALIVTEMIEYGECLQAWLTDWGWRASIREGAASALETRDAMADVIVLTESNAGCALEISNRTQVPVVLVARVAVERPVRLAERVIEVSAFNTEALKEALQLAISRTSAEEIPAVPVAGEETGVVLSSSRDQGETLTVLVVDDSKLNRELLVDQVRSLGYGVLSATCGAEAVVMLHHNPVDIVLTDLDLPGMSGVELLDVVREESPAIPVIAVSANDFDSEVETRLAQGFFDYVAKPVSLERLSRVLVRCHAPHPEEEFADDRWTQETVSMDPAGREALAARFQAHSKEELDELQRLMLNRDIRALERWMHRMRGALLLIGHPALADRCLELELACTGASEWCDDWRTVVDDIEAHIAALCLSDMADLRGLHE
ncbi:hybrid sensor histidine kinase/response regulator [Paraburkholderia fungorum]|uniref:histidine kinase n=1 Tax=Paraburkholderia fungorum TaxID=134537 RepID=A0A3R7E9N9_9BURK|nr:hybrid sensor histidine kinase/response regulator [Paraburkholderia fungorum]RKF49827.1 hypothetical protein BCY88_16750 [Paraburkholderia fungorum]